jgi:hypothetical protein
MLHGHFNSEEIEEIKHRAIKAARESGLIIDVSAVHDNGVLSEIDFNNDPADDDPLRVKHDSLGGIKYDEL